jgi:hypothetical protein
MKKDVTNETLIKRHNARSEFEKTNGIKPYDEKEAEAIRADQHNTNDMLDSHILAYQVKNLQAKHSCT